MSHHVSADAMGYYNVAINHQGHWFELFSLGTGFIEFLVYFFIKLQFSFFNIFLLFSILGVIGFYRLYILLHRILNGYNKNNIWWIIILFALFTFHFNTASIGKDVLVFYGITSVFGILQQFGRPNFKVVLPLLLIVCSRPHIFIILVSIYIGMMFFSIKGKLLFKISVIILGIVVLYMVNTVLYERSGLNLFSLESIDNFFEGYQAQGKKIRAGGNSRIDTSNMSTLFKMFIYSYAPMFWKAKTMMQYIVSIENVFLFVLFCVFLFKKGKYRFFKSAHFYLKYMFIYSLVTWFFLSLTLYNLGLSTRQKYMYIPFLYIFILSFLNIKSEKE